MTRRRLLAALGAASLSRPTHAQENAPRYNTYFGDLHNHNNIGYAQGSLRRTFEIARNHLDFFAFTPHAQWHDIGHYENNVEHKWINGFAVTRARWPEALEMAREFDVPGKFICIPGYEWHSSGLGDYNVIYPSLDAELFVPYDLKQLQDFARKHGAIMIPHHPALHQGNRGANIGRRDPAVSPVLEIYSEWGNAEHDRAPFPYSRHTEPGRWTRNTYQSFLAQGHRLGVVASTDDHLGYPGAYREGLAAVKATALTREAIFDAIRNRRTYAVTGDRIGLDFSVNGNIMGSEILYARKREIAVGADGWDQIDFVEIIKNNRVVHRDFPQDRVPGAASWEKPVVLRFEYGWGPWPALGITRVCDWLFTIKVENGRIEASQTGFQSGPLEEDRRDRVVERRNTSITVQSFTALRQMIDDRSTKAIVLKIKGTPETRVTLALKKPVDKAVSYTLGELAESSETVYTGDFPKESALLHRVAFAENYQTAFTFTDEDEGKGVNWYYARVTQANGQMAWSSPVWVEAAG
ncbi:MAG: DUF3604 domain-containing protein [Bryobacteraceae bacterium]